MIPETALPTTFRGPRRASTAIYFLLAREDFSALHRLTADELWHFYAGSPFRWERLRPKSKQWLRLSRLYPT
ncbi:MAG: cupin domain-containing protein [Bryobacteraceae bacterium]